jgi:hypothetical protein
VDRVSADTFRVFIVVVILLFLFGIIGVSAKVTTGDGSKPASTVPGASTTDQKMCAEGYQPACDEIGR